ncbi:helix-turn-helix transcriptional regulator [Lactococcus lactis]|uniref:helix-turn-helix transcriptional regulator n=1 Tax=Lactococcus lactis TaxID=1358 RepID=UPI00240D1574|nr:helix-turn-helix transcriptional regulator [Lactococcus lactis]WFB96945.1 helix-turn-helix transcriptional regulator [Lactococcus lactis]
MAETLRTHRERAKLTQKEVAEMIGVTPNTINNWEKDSSNLKDFYTKKFMEVYKVTYDDIFLGKEHRISVPLLNKHAS